MSSIHRLVDQNVTIRVRGGNIPHEAMAKTVGPVGTRNQRIRKNFQTTSGSWTTWQSHHFSEARNGIQSLSSASSVSESQLEVLDLSENDLVELEELWIPGCDS